MTRFISRRPRRGSTVTHHQPAQQSQRSGFRTFRYLIVGAFLLVLAGAVYFAAESLEPDQPITDLTLTAVLGFFTLALGWIIVGAWHAKHLDL